MAKQRNELKAGVFILVALALVVASILGFGGIRPLLERQRDYRVQFPLSADISGVGVGDQVRVGGASVGRVRSVDLITDADEPYVQVGIKLPEKLRLRKDAEVTVQITLTGSSWINIRSLGKGPELADGETILGVPSWIDQVMQAFANAKPAIDEAQALVADLRAQTVPKVNTTVDRFRETAETATAAIKRIDARVDPLADKAATLADRGAEMASNIRDIAGDSKEDFRGTVKNLNDTTATLKDRLPGLIDRIERSVDQAGVAIEKATAALTDVQTVAADLKTTAATTRDLITLNRGRIDAMVASLKATGDNLKGASSDIRHSPWRLLYKPGPGERANLNLYDSARQFAEGATAMSDAATALRDAAASPQTDPATLQKLIDQLDASFQQFDKVEQELWNAVR